MAGVTTTILAGVAAVSGIGAAVAQNEANDATRDAARAAKRRADLQSQRQRSEALRQRRIARGIQGVIGEGQGVTDSSGVQGAISSADSQYASNLGLSLQLDRISDEQAARMENASRMMGYAAIFSGLGSAASAASSINFGGGSSSGSTSTTKATGGQGGINITGPSSNFNNANSAQIFSGIY